MSCHASKKRRITDDIAVPESSNDAYTPDGDEEFVCYDPHKDKQIEVKGILFRGDEKDPGCSESSRDEEDDDSDDEDIERKQLVFAAELVMSPMHVLVPSEIFKAFEEYLDNMDEIGEYGITRNDFDGFWSGCLHHFEREEEYDIHEMKRNKKTRETFKKYFEILSSRYDAERRCAKLGKLYDLMMELNSDKKQEQIAFNEENFVNNFVLEKNQSEEYHDVQEDHVRHLFRMAKAKETKMRRC